MYHQSSNETHLYSMAVHDQVNGRGAAHSVMRGVYTVSLFRPDGAHGGYLVIAFASPDNDSIHVYMKYLDEAYAAVRDVYLPDNQEYMDRVECIRELYNWRSADWRKSQELATAAV